MEDFERSKYLEAFGRRIREYRIRRGMSQEELAEKAGYTNRSTITKIEKGRADVPRSKIIQLAQALGVDPVSLTLDDQPTDEDIALARRIAALDPYRRQLIEAILNTDPGQQKKT